MLPSCVDVAAAFLVLFTSDLQDGLQLAGVEPDPMLLGAVLDGDSVQGGVKHSRGAFGAGALLVAVSIAERQCPDLFSVCHGGELCREVVKADPHSVAACTLGRGARWSGRAWVCAHPGQ